MAKKKVIVKVPKPLLDVWSELYQVGDIAEINKKVAKRAGEPVSAETIRVLIRTGEARNVIVYESTISYYEAKQKRAEKLKQKLFTETKPKPETADFGKK